MALRISQLRGCTQDHAKSLRSAGVHNADQLLERGSTAKDRKALAETTGLSGDTILELINRADLARVRGIGRQYSNLLEEAGVDTVPELAQRKAANLHKALTEVAAGCGVKRPPTLDQVEDWVGQAKQLGRAIKY